MSDDHKNQRDAKRTSECEVVLPPPLPPRILVRPADPCSPSVVPSPDKFFEPAPEPSSPADFVIVAPVTLTPLIGATCFEHPDYATGFGGPAVTLDASQRITREFKWQDIPAITEAQLTFLGRLDPSLRQSAAAVTWLPSGALNGSYGISLPVLAATFQLNNAQAQFVIDEITRIATEVGLAAKARAVLLLDCWYENTPTTAVCGEDAETTKDGQSLTVSVTVEAGTHRSSSSIAEANALALIDAQSQLECWWTNDDVTRRCSDVYPAVFADYQAIEESRESPEVFLQGSPNEVTRIHSFSVEAGQYFSDLGKSDANARASEFAEGRLSCFFTTSGEQDCELKEGIPPNVGPALADIVTGEGGRRVELPEGYVVSYVSQATANAIGAQLMDSLLVCLWGNRAAIYECDDAPSMSYNDHLIANYTVNNFSTKTGVELYSSAHGKEIEMLASSDRGVYQITVEANEYTSADGRAAAEEQAEIVAKASLNCIYCNPVIPPVCVNTYTPGMALPLTLNPGSADLSEDATAGVPGLAYTGNPLKLTAIPTSTVGAFICSDIAQEALAVADAVGVIPVKRQSPQDRNNACRYINDRITVSCEQLHPADIEKLHPSSRLAPNGSAVEVEIPAGMYNISVASTVAPATAKAQVNALALSYAQAIIVCEFGNPEMLVFCGDLPYDAPSLPGNSGWGSGHTRPRVGAGPGVGYFGSGTPLTVVHSSSVGSPSSPVVVGRNSYRGSSPLEATLLAQSIASSKLDCFFLETVTLTCEPKPDTRELLPNGHANVGLKYAIFKYPGPVNMAAMSPTYKRPVAATLEEAAVVPSATTTAKSTVSQLDAQQQASALALGLLDCTHINHQRVNAECPNRTDILDFSYVVGWGFYESDSTKSANEMAEAYAKERTICGECAPFRLVPFEATPPDIILGASHGPIVRMCPGSVTLWGITGGTTSGVGAKLETCSEEAIDGFGIKYVRLGSCAGARIAKQDINLSNGSTDLWLELRCCDDGGTSKPALILHKLSGSSVAELETGYHYPPLPSIAGDPEAGAFFYVGSAVLGSAAEGSNLATVYQHMNENLQIFNGGGSSGGNSGAFFGLRTVTEGSGVGDIYLQGGSVGGGTGNATVPDTKLYDASSDTWTGSEGQHLELEVTGDGQTTSGILDPVYNVSSAEISVRASIRDNTLPKVGSTGSRKYHTSLGVFSENGFAPGSPGNFAIGFCAFGYTVTRN